MSEVTIGDIVEALREQQLQHSKATADLNLLLNSEPIRKAKDAQRQCELRIAELEQALVDYVLATEEHVEHEFVHTRWSFGKKDYSKTRPKFLLERIPAGMDMSPFETIKVDWLKVQKHLGFTNAEIPFTQKKEVEIEYVTSR